MAFSISPAEMSKAIQLKLIHGEKDGRDERNLEHCINGVIGTDGLIHAPVLET
jgi:hypothetical protein